MIVDPQTDPPDFQDVRYAREALRHVAYRTPLLRSDDIDREIGRPVWFKAECLQRTGSFKVRGAWNRCQHIPPAELPRGVVAYSSGNHAQGVASAAQRLGVPATIVMPADAPAAKRTATEGYGAKIVLYDRSSESREAIGEEIQSRTGATLIRPFDDAWVIAGQATATLEAIEDADEFGVRFDAMLCPASGGGLLAGAAIVLAERSRQTALHVAEPQGHDDHLRSLEQGVAVDNAPGFRSIADALLAPQPGSLTFSITRRHVSSGIAVLDTDIQRAMYAAFRCLKVVVEPGGAVAFAALRSQPASLPGDGPVLVMLSGGNVDAALFSEAIAMGEATEPT